VLSRWEIDPPLFGAEEAGGELKPIFAALRERSLLRPATPAGSHTCSECGERRRVDYLPSQGGGQTGYIHCPCGVTPVPQERLLRWRIDDEALLAAVFRGISLAIQSQVTGRLWRVGKAHWAGRSREVWFARCFRRAAAAEVREIMARRPKAILFAPTEAGADLWRRALDRPTISLESTLTFSGDGIVFDAPHVEGLLIDAGLGSAAPGRRPPKKRGDRAANIEALRKEMVAHLRAARDHAFDAQERTGEPELLPRPTQKALGDRVGLSESDVSRCLKDETAGELRLYWEAALDLGQIMNWKGPIRRGRKA
jgi:hypothetical protein